MALHDVFGMTGRDFSDMLAMLMLFGFALALMLALAVALVMQ